MDDSVTVTTSEELVESTAYEFKMSQPISNELFYESCNLTSGHDFLFVACNNTFEIYDSADLARGAGLTVNYGEANPAVGVRNSLATDDQGSVTYVHFNRGINRVSRDPDTDTVTKETIVNLIIAQDESVTDAFVLDGLVAVELNSEDLAFFPIPLIKASYTTKMTLLPQYGFDKVTLNETRTYTFAPNAGNETYNMFGVSGDG